MNPQLWKGLTAPEFEVANDEVARLGRRVAAGHCLRARDHQYQAHRLFHASSKGCET
jgi:hypothetical protein